LNCSTTCANNHGVDLLPTFRISSVDLIHARFPARSTAFPCAMCEPPSTDTRAASPKRLTDIGLSLVILLCFLPSAPALLLSAGPGENVIARTPSYSSASSVRYGLDGREIAVYNFRTMSVTKTASISGQASESDSRNHPPSWPHTQTTARGYPLPASSSTSCIARMSLVCPTAPRRGSQTRNTCKLIKGSMVRHK